MLLLLIALTMQDEIPDARTCGVEDPHLLSEEQQVCVSSLSTKLLENGPEFLTIEWPDIVPALASSPHRCLGWHNRNLEPFWPRDDSGAFVNIDAEIVVNLSYDVDDQGRVHDVAGSANDATLPPDTLRQFVLSAETAVSRWLYPTCENHSPAAKGVTTQLRFVIAD